MENVYFPLPSQKTEISWVLCWFKIARIGGHLEILCVRKQIVG